ncbi:MAG: glycosyltransferase family 39 protein [Deltaproteobacteria bacterium]|nr:glycosyltransferase family 39 protein [Deltaproteobacteria bacterium]
MSLVCPLFFRVGATALTDMPVMFCFVLAVFLTLRLVRTPTYPLAVAVGLSIGAGLLCKYTMVFIYPVLLSACVLNGRWRRLVPYLLVATLVSVGMLGTWLGYAAHRGILAAQRHRLTSAAGFVMIANSGRKWLLGVLLLRLPSGLGVYNLPMVCLGGRQILRRRSQADLFVLLWIAAVFVPLMLTLPGPRYFLPAFPALAIAMACGLERAGEAAERGVMLTLLYGGGTLYLFVDWYRAAGGLFRH